MTNEEILKVLKFHNLCCKLKDTIRSGWKRWCVEADRVESVAEHIYGTCMLTVAILSANKDLKLDGNKIIAMMALHECEEIFIGDITPYETEKMKTKKEQGRLAVEKLFADFDMPNSYRELIAEFEDQITPEAKFAKRVDKLEADLMIYRYEDCVNYDKISKDLLNNEIIVRAINEGATCVGDYFVSSNQDVYDDMFKQITKVARDYYLKK
ncbi:MAG: HD domain-containing protein [Clostridia bacterium]|nr:HD domain-containing protein [Clostridia bacterium]